MLHHRKAVLVIMTLVAVLTFSLPVVGAEKVGKININTATVKELTQLKNVGEKYAARIVEYREANGLFKIPEDITKVKGIGKKIFKLNKDVISVE